MTQKLSTLALTIFLSGLFALATNAQVTVSIKDKPLTEALSQLEQTSGYNFFYSSTLPGKDSAVSVEADGWSIGKVLDTMLAGLGISYEIRDDRQIILTAEAPETSKQTSSGNETGDSFEISGTVTDSNGEPLIGVGVTLQGTSTGAITDVDGRYTISVPSRNTVLEFAYLGFASYTTTVGNRSVIDVVMSEDVQYLDEVVVVGYGTQKKVNLTGSVSMVTSEDMASRPISNVSSGLQGLLPGVTVVNPSGQPGSSNTSIRVRGIGTIGNANPLILIDGVEGDLQSLNPDDIESVSVLKDAASSAIYGARAANGVLLITTKKLNETGDAKARVSFGAYFGMQTPTRLPEMADAIEYMTLDNEARANVGTSQAWFQDDFDAVANGTDPNHFGNTDWIGAVLNDYAPQQNYNVTINGNLGSSGYMLSYRYFDQKGLTVGNSTGEKRHNLRFKLNTKIIDRLTLSSNIGYTSSKVTSPVNSLTSGGGAIYSAMRIAPNAPVYYTDGSWAYGGGNTNPVAVLYDGGRSVSTGENLSVLEVLKLDIIKGWDISATYNLTSTNSLRDVLHKTIRFVNPEDGSRYNYQEPNSLRNIDAKAPSRPSYSRPTSTSSSAGTISPEWSECRRSGTSTAPSKHRGTTS